MNDHYRILGISRKASADDVKSAFRAKALETHPDHHPNDAQAAERFRAVKAAFDVLSDPYRRAQHDKDLDDEAFRKKLADALTSPHARAPRGKPKEHGLPPAIRDLALHAPPSPAMLGLPAAAPASSDEGKGLAWLGLILAGIGLFAAASSNSWDSGAGRYRSRESGRFRSGRWG